MPPVVSAVSSETVGRPDPPARRHGAVLRRASPGAGRHRNSTSRRSSFSPIGAATSSRGRRRRTACSARRPCCRGSRRCASLDHPHRAPVGSPAARSTFVGHRAARLRPSAIRQCLIEPCLPVAIVRGDPFDVRSRVGWRWRPSRLLRVKPASSSKRLAAGATAVRCKPLKASRPDGRFGGRAGSSGTLRPLAWPCRFDAMTMPRTTPMPQPSLARHRPSEPTGSPR